MSTGNLHDACHAVIVVAALLLMNAAHPATAQTIDTASDAPSPKSDAVEMLRQGGYVVHLRHTQTGIKTGRTVPPVSRLAEEHASILV